MTAPRDKPADLVRGFGTYVVPTLDACAEQLGLSEDGLRAILRARGQPDRDPPERVASAILETAAVVGPAETLRVVHSTRSIPRLLRRMELFDVLADPLVPTLGLDDLRAHFVRASRELDAARPQVVLGRRVELRSGEEIHPGLWLCVSSALPEYPPVEVVDEIEEDVQPPLAPNPALQVCREALVDLNLEVLDRLGSGPLPSPADAVLAVTQALSKHLSPSHIDFLLRAEAALNPAWEAHPRRFDVRDARWLDRTDSPGLRMALTMPRHLVVELRVGAYSAAAKALADGQGVFVGLHYAEAIRKSRRRQVDAALDQFDRAQRDSTAAGAEFDRIVRSALRRPRRRTGSASGERASDVVASRLPARGTPYATVSAASWGEIRFRHEESERVRVRHRDRDLQPLTPQILGVPARRGSKRQIGLWEFLLRVMRDSASGEPARGHTPRRLDAARAVAHGQVQRTGHPMSHREALDRVFDEDREARYQRAHRLKRLLRRAFPGVRGWPLRADRRFRWGYRTVFVVEPNPEFGGSDMS